MTIFVCVDERFGMLFNHRRQSRDTAVIKTILTMSEGHRLWMDPYSEILFPESLLILKDKDYLQKASNDDFCFLETADVVQYLHRIEKIILFQWNKKYPADLFFPKEILDCGWKLVQTIDIAGSSHEYITMKVYEHEK